MTQNRLKLTFHTPCWIISQFGVKIKLWYTMIERDALECHFKILKKCVNLGKNDPKRNKNQVKCRNLLKKV